jgi:hypothetical protein
MANSENGETVFFNRLVLSRMKALRGYTQTGADAR